MIFHVGFCITIIIIHWLSQTNLDTVGVMGVFLAVEPVGGVKPDHHEAGRQEERAQHEESFVVRWLDRVAVRKGHFVVGAEHGLTAAAAGGFITGVEALVAILLAVADEEDCRADQRHRGLWDDDEEEEIELALLANVTYRSEFV